jgi:hypothetical protein
MIEEMELALDYGKELVESELDTGVFDFIVRPIVTSFYNFWSVHDARIGTLEQIKVTLDCGKYLVLNGATPEQFHRLIEEKFPIYLKNDQTYRQCRKNHKNYQKLIDVTKEMFISQVQETLIFFNVKENVKTYEDLVRAAFKSKDDAYKSLNHQLDLNDKSIKIVEEDKTILKIPSGKNIIINTLRKGFIRTKKYLLDGLNEIYNQ